MPGINLTHLPPDFQEFLLPPAALDAAYRPPGFSQEIHRQAMVSQGMASTDSAHMPTDEAVISHWHEIAAEQASARQELAARQADALANMTISLDDIHLEEAAMLQAPVQGHAWAAAQAPIPQDHVSNLLIALTGVDPTHCVSI